MNYELNLFMRAENIIFENSFQPKMYTTQQTKIERLIQLYGGKSSRTEKFSA